MKSAIPALARSFKKYHACDLYDKYSNIPFRLCDWASALQLYLAAVEKVTLDTLEGHKTGDVVLGSFWETPYSLNPLRFKHLIKFHDELQLEILVPRAKAYMFRFVLQQIVIGVEEHYFDTGHDTAHILAFRNGKLPWSRGLQEVAQEFYSLMLNSYSFPEEIRLSQLGQSIGWQPGLLAQLDYYYQRQPRFYILCLN